MILCCITESSLNERPLPSATKLLKYKLRIVQMPLQKQNLVHQSWYTKRIWRLHSITKTDGSWMRRRCLIYFLQGVRTMNTIIKSHEYLVNEFRLSIHVKKKMIRSTMRLIANIKNLFKPLSDIKKKPFNKYRDSIFSFPFFSLFFSLRCLL